MGGWPVVPLAGCEVSTHNSQPLRELGSKTCSVRCSIRCRGAVVATEVLRRVDVQYRLGVRLLDVAPVTLTGMVIHNTLSISHHWSDVPKPHPQPVLHIHPPKHLRGHHCAVASNRAPHGARFRS